MSPLAVILIAIGGAMAFEGAGWAIFPAQMRRLYIDMFSLGERALHISGLLSVALGVICLVAGVKIGIGD